MGGFSHISGHAAIDAQELPSDLAAVISQYFNAEITQSRNVRSAKLYKTLTKLIEQAAREIEDPDKGTFEQLAYDDRNKTIVFVSISPSECHHLHQCCIWMPLLIRLLPKPIYQS